MALLEKAPAVCEMSGEGVRKSVIAQKVNGTSSGGNESECGESGCAADGQKRQQKKEGDKEKHLPGVQHRGGSMLGSKALMEGESRSSSQPALQVKFCICEGQQASANGV